MPKKIPKPVDRHVGNRVRMQRLMLSMSQSALADAIGVTFQQVQKYEKGSNRIGSSRLQQIGNVLKVPVAFFFEDAPGQFKQDGKTLSPSYLSDFLATPDGLALARAFMAMPDAKLRRSVVAFVREIAGND